MRSSCQASRHPAFQHTWPSRHVSTIDRIIPHRIFVYLLLFRALRWCCTSKRSLGLFLRSRRSRNRQLIPYRQYGRHLAHVVHCWPIRRKCTFHARCTLRFGHEAGCFSIGRRKRTSRHPRGYPVCCGWIDCPHCLSSGRYGSRLLCELI